MVGDVVLAQDPGEDLHRRLELLGDDRVRPQGDQVVHVRHVPRPHENAQPRVGPPGHRHGAAGRHRVGDGQHQHPGTAHPDAGEDLRVVHVTVEDRLPRLPAFPHHRVVQIDHDVGNVRRAQDAGEVLSVHPVPGDDHVVLDPCGTGGLLPGVLRFGPPYKVADEDPPGPWSRPHQERSGHHRQDRGCKKILVGIGAHQAIAGPLGHQEERELPDLRQPDRPDHRNAPRIFQGPDRRGRADRLRHDDRDGDEKDHRQVTHEKRKVEQHPDGDEEDPVEDVPEREDLCGDLVNIHRLGDHHSGEERPHRQGEPPPPGDPRRPEDEAHHRHRQDFPAVQPDDFLKEERDHETRRQQDDPDTHAGLGQRERHGGELRRLPLPERWDEQHHRDHGHVLEQQDADGDLPVAAVDLHPVGVYLQHDRGARKGQDEPDEDRFREGKPREG